MKSLTAGLSGKMLSSSAKGGKNVLARGLKDQDFEVEGEVGKGILQSGEFGPNQINLYSTSTQCGLHGAHRIMTCREASTSSPMMFKLSFLQSWSSHRDPRVKRAVDVVGDIRLLPGQLCFYLLHELWSVSILLTQIH